MSIYEKKEGAECVVFDTSESALRDWYVYKVQEIWGVYRLSRDATYTHSKEQKSYPHKSYSIAVTAACHLPRAVDQLLNSIKNDFPPTEYELVLRAFNIQIFEDKGLFDPSYKPPHLPIYSVYFRGCFVPRDN